MIKLDSKELIWLLMVLNVLRICLTKHDWTDDCTQTVGCYCKWVNGRKQANCENVGLKYIPALSHELQTLILDYNNIAVLNNDVFNAKGLVNLQKLSLKNCEIRDIEKNAFRNLSIVIEIYLNNNHIHKLDPSTFSSTERLRELYLNNNNIEKIEDGLFSNLPFLQTVEMSDNQLQYIGHKAFTNLPVLKTLKLNGNQLKHVKLSIFEKLVSLSSLDLKNNPWTCDCHLRDFVNWFHKHSLYTHPTTCDQPDYLKGYSWNNISANSFACKPEIQFVTSELQDDSEQLMLSCRVTGDPKPDVNWSFNSRTLSNNTNLGSSVERKYTDYESGDTVLWYNVSISKLTRQDNGVYICSAKNPAGLIESNITFSGDLEAPIFGIPRPVGGDVWVLLLCLIIGILCALVLIFMLCFLCCRRVDIMVAKKPSNNSIVANGDITHHIIMEPEQEKTLLTAVNPVQKPPRKYDSSPQSENGGTELTELNRNLLDDPSVLGGASVTGDSMDDRRSTNSLEQLSSCNSQDNLLLQERLRPISTRSHHPPDLLTFPNRRLQASPVGSSVSNELDSTRFRGLHSPVRSPIYQVHPYTPSYEILPYSRTQSPFSPTAVTTPVVSQRQGYVTIPRRPRVPSWSSAPTPTLEDTMCKPEPVYDNLGPRTTADGSSVLSLTRKVALETTPRSTRPLAPSHLYTSHTLPHKTKLNHVYLSIRENEEPHFHAAKESTGVIRPLPLQCSPTEEIEPPTTDGRRASWVSKHPPESGILKKTPNDTTSSSSTPPPMKPKVPPKPPPKPKKSGPLFEDEGEDGTEV